MEDKDKIIVALLWLNNLKVKKEDEGYKEIILKYIDELEIRNILSNMNYDSEQNCYKLEEE